MTKILGSFINSTAWCILTILVTINVACGAKNTKEDTFYQKNLPTTKKDSSDKIDTSIADPLENDDFDYSAPTESEKVSSVNLWATYYYLHVGKANTGNNAIRDIKGKPLGPTLSLEDWCMAAMEGSAVFEMNDGTVEVFNYAGSNGLNKVDCSRFFRKSKVGGTKFQLAKGRYGDGVYVNKKLFILVPYRTIAVDKSIIKPGTLIYIEAARGAEIIEENGRKIIHDGYFMAGDAGGDIHGNHIDVFVGMQKDANFFPWIRSTSTKQFKAVVVKNKRISDELTNLHIKGTTY